MDGHAYLKYQRRIEDAARMQRNAHWSAWPCIRDLARKLRITQQDVLEIAEDTQTLNVCVGVRGGQGGIGSYGSVGDYLIEWMGS